MKPEIDEFSIYKNIGGTVEDYNKDMYAWASEMEKKGVFPKSWCLLEGKIHIYSGSVDMGDEKIQYPIGNVCGHFKCSAEEKKSPNYPEHVGDIVSENYQL